MRLAGHLPGGPRSVLSRWGRLGGLLYCFRVLFSFSSSRAIPP